MGGLSTGCSSWVRRRRLQRAPSSAVAFNCFFCQLVSRKRCWVLANLCRSNNKPEDCSSPASPRSSPALPLCQSYTLPLKRICMQIRWISLFLSPPLCPSHSPSLPLPMCVQSKVSNNVSGRMCLAIEIYLHYYSVLTMRLGSCSPISSPALPFSQSSPCHTVFDLRSRCLDLSLGCPSTRQALSEATHGAKPAPRGSICRLASVSIFARYSTLFPLQSSTLAVQSSFRSSIFRLAGIAFKLQLPRFDSSSLSICKMSIYSSASIQV